MKNNSTKRNFRSTVKICLIALAAIILSLIAFWIFGEVAYDVYETEDIRDYGKYPANRKEAEVEEFLTSFFPESIEPWFEDVSYYYRADNISHYAMGACLEFTIEDDAQFTQFLSEYVEFEKCAVFSYDDRFTEYIVSDPNTGALYDEYFVSESKRDNGEYWLYYAKIGKILFSEEDNRVIFIAIWSEANGADEFSFFFNRFGIDPSQYGAGCVF